jgi:mitochondrial import inner membrane translocase subunit TIM23
MSRFFGRREEARESGDAGGASSSAAGGRRLSDTGSSSGTGSSSSPAFSQSSARGSTSDSRSGSRLYNPYNGLPGTFDPSFSKALLELPDRPEFVFSEEAALQQRSWSENLTFVTGVAYLTGGLAGGAYGAVQGATSVLAIRDTASEQERRKLRLNRILNAGGKSGRTLGNAAGVLGLLYSSLDSATAAVRGGVHDGWNPVVAGAGAGALYMSPAGARAAAVWGGAGALLGALSSAAGSLMS